MNDNSMVETQILYTLTGVSMILAIGIGANDETFAPLVGSKKLTVNQSVLLGGIILILGAITLGFNVADTVGNDIVSQEVASDFAIKHILVILFAVAFSLILGSWQGLPLSTTHAMVGSTIALALIITGGDVNSINISIVYTILASWIISPTLGFIGSYFIMKGIYRVRSHYINGLDDVDRIETLFSQALIVAVVITALSRGGNDVSNAVAPILPLYIELAEGSTVVERIPLFLGGLCMAIGLILIGRRVLRTLGNDVVELSPTTALSVQLTTAIITFTAASSGIPISGTHVLVSAFVGTGIASNSKINKETVQKIAISAVGTPIFAGFITYLFWIFSNAIF